MRAQLNSLKDEAEARRALEEIERLLADAAAGGVRLDPWVAELAEELRAVVPLLDAAGAARIARRLAADPAGSLAAQGQEQGRLRGELVRALKP
jgi:hypothetical protein